MPIEIRELVIKATVKDAAQSTRQSTVATSSTPPDDRDMYRVAEQLIDLIKRKNER